MKNAPSSSKHGASRRLFAGFRADHALVLSELAAAERAALGTRGLKRGSHARLRALVALLARQFATHMAAEESVLYPTLNEVLPESRVTLAPLSEDHVELRGLLASLSASLEAAAGASRDEQIAVQMRDLLDLIRLHIRREESAVFEVAERILGAAEARVLERRIAASLSLPSRPVPPASGALAPRRARKRKP